MGVVSPLYYILHYSFTPIDKFKATDMRLTRISYTKAVLPTLILAYYVPLYLSFHASSFSSRVSWSFFWQLFPVWVSVLAAQVCSRIWPDTTMHDRIYKPTSDLKLIRATVGLFAAYSAATWLSLCAKAGFSLSAVLDMVLPPAHSPQNTTDFVTFVAEFFRFDSAFLFANTFLWLGYLFWDIKFAGMLDLSWIWIILLASVATLTLGPGAAVGLGFLWREELLVTRRHKAAVTEKVAKEWNRKLVAAKKHSKTSGTNRKSTGNGHIKS